MIRKTLITLALVLSLVSLAFAGATTGDITVDSQTGGVGNVGIGTNVNAETNVHSVDVKDGGHTGDITVTGDNIMTLNAGGGTNVNAEANVGSVKVGE